MIPELPPPAAEPTTHNRLEAIETWTQDASKAAARMESRFILSLETLEERLAKSQQDSEDSRKALEEMPTLLWQALQEIKSQSVEIIAQDHELVLKHLEDVRHQNAGSPERAESKSSETEERVVRSLEALEMRVASQDAANEARRKLESLNAKLEAITELQRATMEATTQLASRLDEQVVTPIGRLSSQIVPALKQFEHRIAQLHTETADGRRGVGELSALFTKGLKEFMAAQRASAQLGEKSGDQSRQIRSDLATKLQDIQLTMNARVDSLEKKVDASARTSLNHHAQFVESLEMLERRYASIIRSVEESSKQSQTLAKRSDERLLRTLEALEARIAKLHAENIPLRTAKPASPERRDDLRRPSDNPSLRASQREERLVKLMLNKDPEGNLSADSV